MLFTFDVDVTPDAVRRALTTSEGIASFWTSPPRSKTPTWSFPLPNARLGPSASRDPTKDHQMRRRPSLRSGGDRHPCWENREGTSTVPSGTATSLTRPRRRGGLRLGAGDGAAQALRRDRSCWTGLCEFMRPVDVTTAIEIARPRQVVAAYAADPDHVRDRYANIDRVTWRPRGLWGSAPTRLRRAVLGSHTLLHLPSDRFRPGRAAGYGYGRRPIPDGDDLYLGGPSWPAHANDPP